MAHSEEGAAQSANNLLKKTEVASRISELKEMAADPSAQESVLNRTRVLHRLDQKLGMFGGRSEEQQTIKRVPAPATKRWPRYKRSVRESETGDPS